MRKNIFFIFNMISAMSFAHSDVDKIKIELAIKAKNLHELESKSADLNELKELTTSCRIEIKDPNLLPVHCYDELKLKLELKLIEKQQYQKALKKTEELCLIRISDNPVVTDIVLRYREDSMCLLRWSKLKKELEYKLLESDPAELF